MIFYFSGTGNSRHVAGCLHKELGGGMSEISVVDFTTDLYPGEFVGFVFPVYSWGVPPGVLKFISDLPEKFWEEVRVGHIPVWCVMTCGDEVAMAPEMLMKGLRRRGIEPESIWSVIMPNNYVLLPGFDVDSKEVEVSKLRNMPSRIKEVTEGIRSHRSVVDVTRGSWPRLKTRLVYPLFNRWGISPKKWSANEKCIGCGICAKRCPVGNIFMMEGRPKWQERCVSCLACYHYCPQRAVQYGKATRKKGQYHYPSK